MKEILPGIWHWVRKHPKIGVEVSSYYLADERVLLDPLEPQCGWDKLPGQPKHVLLTNRHHYRDSSQVVERWGSAVWCPEPGLHEFTKGEPVQGFRFGETLPCGVETAEIGVICPDECALIIPRSRAVALADGVVRDGAGPLTFVPDEYLGDDPGGIKAGLRKAYHAFATERDFDHLLLAHGSPWLEDGRSALLEFASAGAA